MPSTPKIILPALMSPAERNGPGAAHVATPLRSEVREVAGAGQFGVVEGGRPIDADVLGGHHGLAGLRTWGSVVSPAPFAPDSRHSRAPGGEGE